MVTLANLRAGDSKLKKAGAVPKIKKKKGKSPPPRSRGENDRRHTRHMVVDGGVLRLAVRPEFRGRRAILVDVSAGGLGFLLADSLEAGTVMVFEIQGSDEREGMSRVARVRNCRPHPVPADAPWLPPAPLVAKLFRNVLGLTRRPGQGWLVGCEFDRPLSEDELAQFLDCLQSIHAKEG